MMKIKLSDIAGDYEFKVDLDNSLPLPETPTAVARTSYGWDFPEDVMFYNDKDEWLYAFGLYHVWKTADFDSGWTLVR